MMKLVIYVFVFAISSCSLVRKPVSFKDYDLDIAFQDWFKGDKISVTLNGFSVIADTALESDKVLGYANLSIKVKRVGKSVYISCNERIIEYKIESNEQLKFVVSVNNYPNFFVFDLLKGKYVGLSKGNNNSLVLWQSKRPYQYD